jgi:hypothetical protein
MKRLLTIPALIAVICFSATAQTPPDKPSSGGDSAVKETLIKMTKEWIDAERRKDGAALDRLLADDFVGIAPSGKVTKKMVVPDPKGPGGGLSFTGDDFVANIYGDMGIVFGNGTWTAQDQGTLCFTLAFVKRGERWQIVTVHLSQVPQQ